MLQWFQTYEYIRNFLSRSAWMRADGLLLISGAFAGYRRGAVLSVGGFDPGCLVEDYELIHRLRRSGVQRGLTWRTAVLGEARARTDAPATIPAFLRQRRRWFGGFLQTQWWYRDMVGDARYGRLGTLMLPVKAMDTLQPLYGLTAFALLLAYLATGPAGGGVAGGRRDRRQDPAGFQFESLVRASLSPLVRRAHARRFRGGVPGGSARAVQFPVAAAHRRGLGLGGIPDRPGQLGPPAPPMDARACKFLTNGFQGPFGRCAEGALRATRVRGSALALLA